MAPKVDINLCVFPNPFCNGLGSTLGSQTGPKIDKNRSFGVSDFARASFRGQKSFFYRFWSIFRISDPSDILAGPIQNHFFKIILFCSLRAFLTNFYAFLPPFLAPKCLKIKEKASRKEGRFSTVFWEDFCLPK